MEIVALFALLIAVPFVALLWSRRHRGDSGTDHRPGADPQANRDIGATGPPPHSQGGDWGGAGGSY